VSKKKTKPNKGIVVRPLKSKTKVVVSEQLFPLIQSQFLKGFALIEFVFSVKHICFPESHHRLLEASG
jgi:hypothetical protein